MLSRISKKILPYVAATLIGLNWGAHSEGLQEGQNIDERRVSIENTLNQYGEIETWKDSQNGRFYIISSDRDHMDTGIAKNSTMAFSDLVEKRVIRELALEGRYGGEVEVIEEDSPIRKKYSAAAKGDWDSVSDENYFKHGESLVALENPGVELVGIDDADKIIKSFELSQNREKLPSLKSRYDRLIIKLADERSEIMADHLENHPALSDTIGVRVGSFHIEDILENISPESGYVIFNPNGGKLMPGEYSDYMDDMIKYAR